jgi:FAD/FMN-containing dehydrogenase
MTTEETAGLAASLHGTLISPDSTEYEVARKVFNAMIDRHPRLIIRCANVADVRSAVNFARTQDITVAVRGGGHNGAGLGVCDHGIVIDLSAMKGVRVDPSNNTVRAEPGCTQADLNHAAHGFGLVVPAGIISTSGIAGLTLGGGTGYLTRKYGPALDNLLEADLVLADGTFVTANEQTHSDLFWAIRGGGGNFGIVTSFLFRACPVDQVFAGPMLWDMGCNGIGGVTLSATFPKRQSTNTSSLLRSCLVFYRLCTSIRSTVFRVGSIGMQPRLVIEKRSGRW